MAQQIQTAIIAGVCFWCIEAAFNSLKGVISAVSGYSGGHVIQPTYEQVITGETGHAEVVRVKFDPELITYREVLEIFFSIHDPTQLNRQGNDIGSQYRSAIYFADEAQQREALNIIEEMTLEQTWDAPIVTEVEPQEAFYPAEDYHQDYFNKHPENRYCQAIVSPKLLKFKKTYAKKLRDVAA